MPFRKGPLYDTECVDSSTWLYSTPIFGMSIGEFILRRWTLPTQRPCRQATGSARHSKPGQLCSTHSFSCGRSQLNEAACELWQRYPWISWTVDAIWLWNVSRYDKLQLMRISLKCFIRNNIPNLRPAGVNYMNFLKTLERALLGSCNSLVLNLDCFTVPTWWVRPRKGTVKESMLNMPAFLPLE